jgi:hypothetical protein
MKTAWIYVNTDARCQNASNKPIHNYAAGVTLCARKSCVRMTELRSPNFNYQQHFGRGEAK